jgi:hypothetical protein
MSAGLILVGSILLVTFLGMFFITIDIFCPKEQDPRYPTYTPKIVEQSEEYFENNLHYDELTEDTGPY